VSYPPPPAGLTSGPLAIAPRLRWLDRLAMIVAGGVLLGLLATAGRLTPNQHGQGTHQQLGLPPCTILAWYGIRCPSCGMTTSWSHVVRGQVFAAIRANAGGTLLALVALAAGPWLLVSGLRGRWLFSPPRETWVLAVALTIVTITLIDWVLRLSFG
jgi:hypothetical protein